jgi:hypothetical protein
MRQHACLASAVALLGMAAFVQAYFITPPLRARPHASTRTPSGGQWGVGSGGGSGGGGGRGKGPWGWGGLGWGEGGGDNEDGDDDKIPWGLLSLR